MTVKVTIGLCIKSFKKTVKTAIDSVAIQDYPHEDMTLLIVSEESQEKTSNDLGNLIREIDIKTLIFSSHGRGLGASRQIVVDNAEGEYIVWVDDDFVLKSDFIRKNVEFMEKNLRVGAALAKEIKTRKTLVATFESYNLLYGSLRAVTIPLGDFQVFRLKALNQVGRFDTSIKGAGEDIDISRRIRDFGWELSTNNSSEYCRKHPPETWKTLWRKRVWYGYGNHFLSHKYPNKTLQWDFNPFFAIGVGLRNSITIYPANHEKKVFLFPLYSFFTSAASFLGFFQAHLDGYGHVSSK